MASKNLVDAGAAARLLIASRPSIVDEIQVKAVFGEIVFSSLNEVARALAVEPTTVKNTWRPSGMPGSAQPGPGARGRYVLSEIVVWLLGRSEKNDKARGVVKDEYTDIRRDAETRKVLSEARLREIAVEQKEGEYISVEWAKSEITAAFNKVRDAVMSIGRSVMPFLPKKQAVEIRDEIDRQCEKHLNAAADSLLDAVDQRDEEPSHVDSAD